MCTENREKGASAVEFALVLPLLMLVLFGIIEFGFILYDKAVITNASREGARKGIAYRFNSTGTGPGAVPTTEVISTVTSYAGTYLISLGGTTPALPPPAVSGDCSVPGSALTVTVTYPYTFLVLPNLPSSAGAAGGTGLTPVITLTAVTVMNCENQLTF